MKYCEMCGTPLHRGRCRDCGRYYGKTVHVYEEPKKKHGVAAVVTAVVAVVIALVLLSSFNYITRVLKGEKTPETAEELFTDDTASVPDKSADAEAPEQIAAETDVDAATEVEAPGDVSFDTDAGVQSATDATVPDERIPGSERGGITREGLSPRGADVAERYAGRDAFQRSPASDPSADSGKENAGSSAPSGTFTVGSTKDEVRAVMGAPTDINVYSSTDTEIWSYSYSTVTFIGGKVAEYSNLANNLRIKKVEPDKSKSFSLGSTKDEVLAAMGTPTGINVYSSTDTEIWSYSYSTVTFIGGKVAEYSDLANNLRIEKVKPDESKSFSLGSTKDEVLAAMGTPTGINVYSFSDTEIWSYSYSTVTFKNGKVTEYSDLAKNLRVK